MLPSVSMPVSQLPFIRPLLRKEYDHLVELGAFDSERVELLNGYIVRMTPQRAPHASVVQRLTRRLIAELDLPGKASVRCQLPLALTVDSEPEPDLAIVPSGDYELEHPRTASWVIEVADRAIDRGRIEKAGIYAAALVPEYWVINVARREIEVRTEPADGAYMRVTPYRLGESVSPRAFPELALAIDEIMPASQ
jgi:Uma2 family endonuclease